MAIRTVLLAAGLAAIASPAWADKFCDQMKVLEKAGNETPRFASLTGETLADPYRGAKYTMGTLDPQGLETCLIQRSDSGPVQMRYECTGPDATAKGHKALFDKLIKGVETCFKAKGVKTVEPDYTLMTYTLEDTRRVEIVVAEDEVSLTYYPKPG